MLSSVTKQSRYKTLQRNFRLYSLFETAARWQQSQKQVIQHHRQLEECDIDGTRQQQINKEK